VNTQAHLLVNHFVLSRNKSSHYRWAVFIGALVPDVSMVWFYFYRFCFRKICGTDVGSLARAFGSYQGGGIAFGGGGTAQNNPESAF